jgi:arsenate reductase-like glutaredoxin family protein
MTCGRAQEFLAHEKVDVKTQADAKKERFDRDAALRIAREATEIWVAKGKRAVHIVLARDKPSDDALAELILGPAGNLRAPALRRGTKLLIGFDPATYAEVLGGRG